MIVDTTLVQKLLPLTKQAGEAIMEIYRSGNQIQVSVKADYSPLTVADRVANGIITRELTKLFPAIPVLSEEGSAVPFDVRKNWEYYWCVDPLDGTKEFIHRRDEFTVNIALIHFNRPVLGVIYAPAFDAMYYGSRETGSWKQQGNHQWQSLVADAAAEEWTAIGSRSHASSEEQEVLKTFPVTHTIAAGSSLKFCRIAEGLAHLYYRHGPTMEWDTAAGQIIAESSGAVMTTITGNAFLYNKPSLKNSGFICRVKNSIPVTDAVS